MRVSLSLYLREAALTPFAWGRADCALFVADWVARRTGIDAAASVRGRYTSPRGARRILAAARDADVDAALVAFVARRAAAAGLVETAHPVAGDIAVVTGVSATACCAIRTASGGWAVRADRAVIVARSPRVLAAWGLSGGTGHG